MNFEEIFVEPVIADAVISQVVYLDFDGAEAVYSNDDLAIKVGVTVQNSGFSAEQQETILSQLNEKYAGVVFTTEKPVAGPFSTVFVGASDDFAQYGSFMGISETVDSGNLIKNDNAFAFVSAASGVDTAVSVIAHEVGHLLGQGHAETVGGIEDYAAVVEVKPGEIVKPEKMTASDFDGNGVSDILFQNLLDSANPLGAWMNANKWEWNGALGPAPKSDWTVYGAFDFTGDGVCDIMFRSKLAATEYAVGYYDMGNGAAFKTMGWGVTAEWELANVGDFNGNGVCDILWKNTTNGYLGLWMDGTNEWVALPASALGAGQSIIDVGDADGDGSDDILINSNGVLGSWDISGIISGNDSTPVWHSFGITVSSDWETIGSADFDGNGVADIVLWNDNGYIGTYMNCDANDFRGIYPTAAKDEWGIPGFGDYNGDGYDDVLVRNLASGALGYWDGHNNFQWNEIGFGVDSTWSVIA